MIPSLRGVQRQHCLPGPCSQQQQHFVKLQSLLLSAHPNRSETMPVRKRLVQSSRLVNTPSDYAAAGVQQPTAAQQLPKTAAIALPDDLTAAAGHALLHGNGLARAVLSDPGIEGDPLAFLKGTEAYWKAMKQQKHEPHKKGPTVITTSSQPFATLLPATNTSSSNRVRRRPSFGVAPRPADLHHLDAAAATSAAAAASTGSSSSSSNTSVQPDFDVVMCGGVLGIVIALALQQQGFRVAVVEKRLVQGRTQEWNSSRHECQVLVDMGLLSQAELEAAIVSEFNPVRVGFKGGDPLWVQDCLNIGVSPESLIASLRARFEACGGIVYEQTAFKSAVICPDGVVATLASAAGAPAGVADTNRPNALTEQQQQQQQQSKQQQGQGQRGAAGTGRGAAGSGGAAGGAAGGAGRRQAPAKLSCRLLLDCMGHYSTIVKQMRGRAKPDGMVLVVGGCATGFPAELNTTADLLTTITDASADMQLFWEAFPAEGGAARTTYMFAYSDAHPDRPSFERLLDAYFALLPAYQGLGPEGLNALRFKRVLFGGFPCYADSPLKPGFDRVLQLGDASATQSPLSFGGFGTMLRHLPRFSSAIAHALKDGKLLRADLAWIHPYQPSLSAAMLFQRSMSVGVGQLQPEQQRQQQSVQEQEQGQVQRPAAVVAAAGSGRNGAHSTISRSSNGQSNGHSSRHSNGHGEHSSSNGHNGRHSGSHSYGTSTNGSSAAHTNGHGNGNGTGSAPAHSNSREVVHWTVISNGADSSAAVAPPQPTPNSSSLINEAHVRPAATTTTPSSSSSSSSKEASQQPHTARLNWLQQLALLPSNHINSLLGANFGVMLLLGQRVLKPFLQDTLQLLPLGLTMAGMMFAKPLVISRVLLQIGPKMLLGWFGHFAALAAYSVGHMLLSPLRRFSHSYTLHRLLDALRYGSASDYCYTPYPAVPKAEAAALQAKLTAGVVGLAGSSAGAAAHAGANGGAHKDGRAVQRLPQQQWGLGTPAVAAVPRGAQEELWDSPEFVSHLGHQVRYT